MTLSAAGRKAGNRGRVVRRRAGRPRRIRVEREDDRPVPRVHGEEITVDGETQPVTVKPGVWISNTKSRRDKPTTDQLAVLAKLGRDWTKPVAVPQPPRTPLDHLIDHFRMRFGGDGGVRGHQPG
ncbi:hypothetical protein [Streptomyces sp. NPDC012825]|uniref:hypothetical protein n=1 Tax=Streptomyces sp. NPDC012825 TaxID=3364851 RepID=UPI003693721E